MVTSLTATLDVGAQWSLELPETSSIKLSHRGSYDVAMGSIVGHKSGAGNSSSGWPGGLSPRYNQRTILLISLCLMEWYLL